MKNSNLEPPCFDVPNFIDNPQNSSNLAPQRPATSVELEAIQKLAAQSATTVATPASPPLTMRQLAEITGLNDRQLLKVSQIAEKLKIDYEDAIMPLIMLSLKNISETENVAPAVKGVIVEVEERFSKFCAEKSEAAALSAANLAATGAASEAKKLIFRALTQREKTPSAWRDRGTVLGIVIMLCIFSFFLGNAAGQWQITLEICQFLSI